MQVARVPTYSPESVAEHSVSLAMALNRFAPTVQSCKNPIS